MLNLPKNIKPTKSVGKFFSSILRSKFDIFWLKRIRETQINEFDNVDHNKLRVYRQFKSCFSREPYIECVRNRNQRSFLTRLRVSAHSLAIELGRRTRPITPYLRRTCTYCQPNDTNTGGSIDTEIHFLVFCDRFEYTRNCFSIGLS